MKKLVLFLLLLFLCTGTMFSQQLSFRFANPKIIRVPVGVAPNGIDHLQFDIQIMSSVAGTYLWASQIILNFDNTTFDNTSLNWKVIPQGAFAGLNSSGVGMKYTTTRTVTLNGGANVYNIALTGDASIAANGPNATDFAEIPTTWTTIVTVSARLLNLTGDGLAGINFLPSSMDGFQQYISAPSVFTNYTNPNLYDSHNFLADYTGRFYSTLYGWSQIGGPTNNVQYLNWATPLSTTAWEGTPSIPTGTTVNNLMIDNPATLTIPQTGQLTVTGNTNVQTPNGLTILSDATGTGSLITGSSTGVAASTIAQRWMSAGKWNNVSSPVSGQSVANFLTNNPVSGNNGIAVKNGNVGILEYLPVTNAWSTASATGPAGNLGQGKGFSLRLPGLTAVTNDGSVTFNGLLQAGTINPPVTPFASTGYWNCIGNPYTSAIRLTDNTTPTPLANFLTANVANLVSGSAIYVWQAPDASNGQTGKYTTYSNVNAATIQEGQAFLVNVVASPLSFTSAIQIHSNATPLKTKKEPWPSINLSAAVGEQKNTTLIAFNHDMTKGLDPTYDASLIKGGTDLLVYSRLVEGDATPFAIQALPDNESDLVVPIGLDFKTGGEVIFSSEMMNLPKNSKVVLEDVLNKTYTDLSKENYKVVIEANSSISNRFFLHTTFSTAKPDNQGLKETLNAYAVGKTEIRVVGPVSNKAIATLYDIHGRDVFVKSLEEGILNVIPLPNIKVGVYMLTVIDNGKRHSFKILIGE